MTFPEDLSPEAKHLLRAARGGDRAQRSEVSASVQRFRQSRAEHRQPRRYGFFGSRHTRRATPWAIAAALCSATLGAYATVGQSLGLPVPGWWPEFTAWSPVDTASAPRPSRVPQGKAKSESQSATSDTVGHTATSTIGETAARDEPATPNGTAALPEQRAAPLEPFAEPPPVPEAAAVARNSATPWAAVEGKTPSRAVPSRLVPSSDEIKPDAPEALAAATSSVASSGPLGREVQLITAARDALDSSNYAAAKRHLDTHGLEFPRGSLSEERQALFAICECRTGGGSNAAQTYVSRPTETPLTRRVAKECGLNTKR